MRLKFTVNGRPQQVDDVWAGESLLYVLRERLGLPGSKNACEQGECGSCTVALDGVAVCACLVAAGQVEGREVGTVEGLAEGDELGAVQQAFLDTGAVQCGFCTPGFVMTAVEILETNRFYTDDELRKLLSGHLCRCTGYENILRAVKKTMYRRLGREIDF